MPAGRYLNLMKRLTSFLILGVSILSLSGLASCSSTNLPTPIHEPPAPAVTVISAPTEIPLPSPTETATPENLPTATSLPTRPPVTAQPTSPPATLTPISRQAVIPAPCTDQVCIEPGTFFFQRPIAPPGRNTVDTSYRFGDNEGGLRDVHHGVEFLNSAGTPVLAAGDGTVVVAGDDKKTIYGLYPNAYGNLVVIQHSLPGISQPVFTVYGHLSKIDVKQGDTVQAGQKIGEVGATGAATGPHLHFEVRLGENTYAASRNPELWLKPLSDKQGQLEGGIAGSILSANGNQISVPNIVIQPISTTGPAADAMAYIHTYDEKKLVGESPWDESFAAGGLPAGKYKISFIQYGYHTLIVQVQPGELTLVTFRLDQ
jgi:murein DD-endopeptidase MepM/ murein hydrolase activator NlpD